MKAVLISIQPKWCELIANGKKTVEVRKTKPKIDVPFKCYIYCTQGKSKGDFITKSEKFGYLTGHEGSFYNRAKEYDANGKVIGEFVCDRVFSMSIFYSDVNSPVTSNIFPFTCLTDRQIIDYLGNGGNGYGWHISDLVIYDKPKELSEFYHACKQPSGTDCSKCLDKVEQNCWQITRPPQSWCYVEERSGQ